jgi:lipopolysaccharide transport system ATP-binding protein
MSDRNIAIRVENIGKRYRIGLKDDMHDNMLSTFLEFVKSPLNNYRKYRSLYEFDDVKTSDSEDGMEVSSDIIWALKDISFEVKKGDVLGIIGSNGAGKSTLLKILAKITDPTTGYAKIRGRISSLLEVGTGFHPELTGRENVYLNGTILGMTKKEVDEKFNEIIEFSGIGKFIDTPVKRYSSGMKVRLAFSVAAHLEPDILLIDEVLAVGDIAFQRKCLGKMDHVAKTGKTILFVSHNMAAVSALCPKSIFLEKGRFRSYGDSTEIIKKYTIENSKQITQKITDRTDRDGDGRVKVTDIWIENEANERVNELTYDDSVHFNISYVADDSYNRLDFIISIYDSYDQRLLRFDTQAHPVKVDTWPTSGILSCKLDGSLPLRPGKYRVMVTVLAFTATADRVQDAMTFNVMEGDFYGSGRLQKYWPLFLMNHEWTVETDKKSK